MTCADRGMLLSRLSLKATSSIKWARQADNATGDFYHPQPSAVNTLRSNIYNGPPTDGSARRVCVVCRPLEMYSTTSELLRDQAITESARHHADAPVQPLKPTDKHVSMKHVAEQAKGDCSFCRSLLQVYMKAYTAKSVFWCKPEELLVRRSLDRPDATVLRFQSAGLYALDIELFYEPGRFDRHP